MLSSCGSRIDECYSKLYVSFWEEVFRFSEAEAFLSLDRNRSSVTFSKLHSKRIPLIFHHERPRLYRLLDPENFIYLVSGIVKNIEKVGSEKYLNLILDRLKIVFKTIELESFAVYGSVARGAASNHSDINILLVSDSFEGVSHRGLTSYTKWRGQLEGELRLLRGHGAYTPLSLYPSEKGGGHEDAAALLDLTRRPQYSMTGMIFSNSYYSSLRRSYG